MSEENKKRQAACDCGCEDTDCDCGNEDCCDENEDLVELVDDDGNTVKFNHVATIDYENNWYVFFSPVEKVEGIDTDEVVIFRLDADEEGKDIFSPIEDEELLQKVYDEYVKVMEEDDEEACGESGCEGCKGCGK
jgi:uncharacterized protein YrzB (UPF0473 family)